MINRNTSLTAVAVALGLALMAAAGRGGAPAGTSNGTPARTTSGAVAKAYSTETGATLTAIRDARVFDGERVLERATVVLADGRIRDVGPNVAVPVGAELVDGGGRTLLPGLIDAHTHVFGDALERALAFGVTTELDMFTDPQLAARLRHEQREGRAAGRADLFSAGVLVTAPGGHGTEYGLRIPTLARAEDAAAFVEARVAEGSDYIKAVLDGGGAYGLDWPTLDRPTLEAVGAAAHARGRLLVVHVGSARGAQAALEAGADGLVHLFADAEPASGFVETARRSGAFVVPTLSVIESLAGAGGGEAFAKDVRLSPLLSASEAERLASGFPLPQRKPSLDTGIARRTVQALARAGVPVLAGTDAPNPGTAHGASLHRELELLVAAGLLPAQALASATAVPARVFKLADRGRIAPGLRANLVLVEGDPTREITATRAIVAVWKDGVRAQRRRPEAIQTPRVLEGTVSDFEAPEIGARFGSGWVASSDDRMGGRSEARIERAGGGANGSQGALRVSGALRGGAPYPWSGAMLFPGPSPMTPADLSAFGALRFRARGDGRMYRVLLFSARLGQVPLAASFAAGGEWAEVRLPFAGFAAALGGGAAFDGSDVTGVLFTAGPAEGEFAFEIDDVAFVAPS